MTAARTADLVRRSVDDCSAVPAFNVITLEHAEGAVRGLERSNSAGILQFSERALLFHGEPVEPILAAVARLAGAADVPVALHLDHIENLDLARRLVDASGELGVTSIMVDFSTADRDRNVELTRAAVDHAQAAGLWVEAELGEIGGKDGAHAHGARTDPEDARDFTAQTGVDALAVAIGSSHAMTSRDARLDLELLGRLVRAVPVPLVLHGSSGVPEHELVAAVAAGIRKVNVGTALNLAYTDAVRRVLDARPDLSDPREYLAEAREAVAVTVADFARAIRTAPTPTPAQQGAPE
jgi:fructose-bisphosphate aldolase class II